MKAVTMVASALIVAGLFGCATQAPQPPTEPVATVPAQPEPPAPLPPRPFTSDTLYALLSAEIAGSRGRFDVALANYLQQAQQTGDPQVAERAYMIARYLGDEDAALRSAGIWAQSKPGNQDAQAAAILTLIEADRLLEAFEATRNANTRDNGALLQSIAANAQQVTDIQREQLLEQYQQMRQSDPDNVSLMIGTGLLLQQQGRDQQALALAQQAMVTEPDNTHALVLTTGLLHQLGRNAEALEMMEQRLAAEPGNTRARLQYARLLSFSDLAAAQEQFQQLAEASPRDADLQKALALIAEERGDTDTAERAYHALLDLNHDTSAAHFYLGRLAEQRGETAEALKHYQKVEPGDEFANANARIFALYLAEGASASAENHYRRLLPMLSEELQMQLTLIYNQQLQQSGQHEQALTLLNDALNQSPENSAYLYARSMVHDQLGQHERAESDLRSILQYDPTNAGALNALGYILTENTDRYSEAYEYIKHALELQPDDPATIDSMGWVQYHLGNLDIALRYLRRAMTLYPDHEIAAHLGEVLWVSGMEDEAREVWRQGLSLQADSEYIRETLERLQIDRDSLTTTAAD